MKKILGLAIAAIAVIAVAGVSTWAYFSDTETSTNNIFAAGTLDLKTSNDAVNYTDGVTATWGSGNNPVAPGYSSSGTVTLKNLGNIAADHIEMKFTDVVVNNVSYNSTDLGPDIADMSSVMQVTALSYGGTSILASEIAALDPIANGGNGDGILELNELNGKTISSTTIPGTNGNTPQALSMTVAIPGSVGNGIQGDVVTLTVTFGLFQDASGHLP